ncbi:hypothetical protein D3C75_856430 [compost metagenome]
MTFFEGAETDQGHGVLVQGTRDAVENRVQNLIGLFLGQIGLFGDDGGEFWFAHSEASLTEFLLLCRAALGAALKAPQALICGRRK